jgi:S-DNA-T family DNA segregation ATPase FtsK/SpoIIIE
VRLVLIDPKRVELGFYNGIPHLYVPVVTDPAKAAAALAWAVVEMERRLKIFEKVGVKNVKQYNKRYDEEQALRQAAAQLADAESDAALSSDPDAALSSALGSAPGSAPNAAPEPQNASKAQGEDLFAEHMPYIVIVIDELADLMMVAGKDIESSIVRLAQRARAAGLHLIVATQRPSSTVITGLIKANIVNRIAFTVASGIDSRVILDTGGAEDLIGKGDLLFSRPEYSKPVRIQGCIVTEQEIETVVNFLQSQGEPDYHDDIFLVSGGSTSGSQGSAGGFGQGGTGDDNDPLLWEAAEIIVSAQLGSTSALQRRLKVGYARAGRIMDELEDKGIVGSANGSKPREVYISDVIELETLRALETQMGDEW